MNEPTLKKPQPDRIYFLSEILSSGIYSTYDRSKRIGKLTDVIIVEKGTIPHVMDLVISRPFGEPSLIIPIDKIVDICGKTIVVNIESIAQYEGKPAPDAMLLRDYVLDKKIIDTEDRDVSVVYDAKIIQINKKLYVTDVELNRYGLFKRVGLKWLADFLKIKEDTVSWKYIQALPSYISGFRGDVKLTTIKEKLADIPPVDLADIIEELNEEQRTLVLNELGPENASEIFEEVDPNVQREIVSSLDKKVVVRLIDEMTPAQAADVLSALPHTEKESLFALINPDLSKKIKAIFNHHEECIENYLTKKFICFTYYDNVEKARNEFPAAALGSQLRHYVYIIDSSRVLQGIVDISDLLTHDGGVMLRDIMTDKIISLTLKNSLKDSLDIFVRYGFRSIPVLDEEKKMLGVILYKDIMNLKHRFV
jgi:magnesium transporter